MVCRRCEVTPWEKPLGVKEIILYASHEYMLQKIYENFRNDFTIEHQGEYLRITEDFSNFIRVMSASHPRVLTTTELQNIYIMICQNPDLLKPQDFKSIRTLEQWIYIYQADDLQWILEHNAIVTYFQAIVDVHSRAVIGYECLSRGKKQDGSLMAPKEMFRLAEKADLLFYLDRLCRIQSLRSAKENAITTTVFINFVPNAIYNPEFCLRTTIHVAKELHYDLSKVVFEVTESYRIENYEHLQMIIDYYRNSGFKVALDDVGSGFANFEMLMYLKPDIVKIDMNFVRNVHREPLKKVVIMAITRLAQELGIKTIAEGVETEEEFSTIKDLGVDYAQGYLFGKPTSRL